MTCVLIVLGLAAVGLLFALSIDGVISRKMDDRAENAIGNLRVAHRKEALVMLADYPFKNCPATNGATLTLALLAIGAVTSLLLSGAGVNSVPWLPFS
jgi:hypothetical protein